jgi:hypothetical protein
MDDVQLPVVAFAGNLTPKSAGKAALSMIIATLGGLSDTPQSLCGVACKPVIAVKSVSVSDAQDMRRVWTAVLIVDAPHCATTFGHFEIDFTRAKETAPELQFTELFAWRTGEVRVSIDLWWDESVTDYRIGFIAPCVCKESQL